MTEEKKKEYLVAINGQWVGDWYPLPHPGPEQRKIIHEAKRPCKK